MREKFYAADEYNFDDVQADAVWACQIIEVEGGWLVFESIDDYKIWDFLK